MWVCGWTLGLLIALCAGQQVVLPDLGPIEGTSTVSAWTKRTIFQYRGIPYAEPPIGNLRFKRPVKYSTPSPGTFDATNFGPVCPQDSYIKVKLGKEVMSEDCLHINVYTPKLEKEGEGEAGAQGNEEKKKLPVMVFLHGGLFMVGSARNVVPEFLLEEDIVLAVPQYRLGPLGFLSLKTDEVPGNQGMLDILLALEWVNKNIEHFGGDPSRVTLFGQSAGAAAASLMLFSPLVKEGLFQQMIIEGASGLAGWALDPDPVKHAQMIAAKVNCTQDNMAELAQCLRDDNTTVQRLLKAHTRFRNEGYSGGNNVVWNEAGDKSFLLDDPRTLLEEGKFKTVPLMGGVTKHEGSFVLADIYARYGCANLTDVDPFVTPVLKEFITVGGAGNGITGLIRQVMAPLNFVEVAPGLVDILGVLNFKACLFSMVKAMRKQAPSYLYSFNYYGRFSCNGSFSTLGIDPDYLWDLPFPAGVAHADTLLYLFPQKYIDFNEEEMDVSRMMVQYWTSFATTGVPEAEVSPEWPKFITTQGPYMRIELKPTVQENFKENEYNVAIKEGLERPKKRSPIMCPCIHKRPPACKRCRG